MPTGRPEVLTPDEFWSLVTFLPDTGCWLWSRVTESNPYGTARVEGVATCSAHRIAWALSGRTFKRRKVIAHKCDVKGCVNPDHLEQVSYGQNSKDAWSRLRPWRKPRGFIVLPRPSAALLYGGSLFAGFALGIAILLSVAP